MPDDTRRDAIEIRPAERQIWVNGKPALTDGLVAMPDIPPAIMAAVEAMEAEGHSLHAWLTREDPEAAGRLSPADRPRLQRAVSVHLMWVVRPACAPFG